MSETQKVLEGIDQMSNPLDLLKMLQGTGLKIPGLDAVDDTLGKALGPVGAVVDTAHYVNGVNGMEEGVQQRDALKWMRGFHDGVDGASGIASHLPGGEAAGGFGLGYAYGDLIAPLFFGSYEDANRPHMETVPEEGFHPTSGNAGWDPLIAPVADFVQEQLGDEPQARVAHGFDAKAVQAQSDALIARILAEAQQSRANDFELPEQPVCESPY